MIRSFRSKALRRYWKRSDESGLRPDWVRKIAILLDALNSAQRADDVNVVGSGFHALTGNLAGRYAMTISRNWRLTFGWSGEDATDVDLEDYHG